MTKSIKVRDEYGLVQHVTKERERKNALRPPATAGDTPAIEWTGATGRHDRFYDMWSKRSHFIHTGLLHLNDLMSMYQISHFRNRYSETITRDNRVSVQVE